MSDATVVRPPLPDTGHRRRRPGRRSTCDRILGLVALTVALAWAVVATAQAFTGTPSGGGWSSVRAQLHWVPTILTSVPRNLGTFLVVSCVVVAMGLPGTLLLRLARVHWHDRFEHAVFAIAAGLAGWVPVLLLVGTYVGLSRLEVAVTTGVYIALPALKVLPPLMARIADDTRGLMNRAVKRAKARFRWLDALLVVVLLALLYMALLGALIPEVQFDARWYHLGSAAHYVEVGHFYNIVAATHDPALGLNPYQEVGYTGFFALAGAHASKAFAFLDLPLICAAIIAFARVHFDSTRLGLLAAIAFVSVPIASWSAATASNDLPVALYTLIAVHAVFCWLEDPGGKWGYAYLGIAMAAFTWGVKAFGLLTLALCVVIVLATVAARAQMRNRAVGKRLLVMGAIVIIVCAPWWIRVGAMTGNPVFPLAYQYLPSDYWNQFAAAGQNHFNRHVSLATLPVGLPQTLWNTVTDPVPYQVIAGPLFLVGVPLTLLLAGCTRRRLRPSFVLLGLFLLGWWIGWYIGGFSTSRYLVAIAPLTCLWMAIGIADAYRHPRFGRALPMVTLVVMAAICLSTIQPLTTLQRGSVAPGVEGSIPYDWNYLYKGEPEADVQLNALPMVAYIDAHLDPHTTKVYDAATLYSTYEYLLPEMYDGTTYGSPPAMHQWTIYDPDALAQIRANGITHLVIPVAAIDTLRLTALWPHLVELHRSPDGIVLYAVR